jgi:hypothetical protein
LPALPGIGPAWAVVSLVTTVVLFFALSPAASAETVRLPSCGGTDFIDAPMVVVDAKSILVDGSEVTLAALPDVLKKKHEYYATYRHQPIDPAEEVIIYKMAPDTPASVIVEVNDAARAAGFTTPAFMR